MPPLQVIAPAVPAPVTGQALATARGTSPVVARSWKQARWWQVLEINPVAVTSRARKHQLHAVVRAEIRSVGTTHPLGLTRAARAALLRAVAVTPRNPPAVEADRAWAAVAKAEDPEAAVVAVVVARAADPEAAAVAVVAAEDKTLRARKNKMKTKLHQMTSSKFSVPGLLLSCMFGVVLLAAPHANLEAAPETKAKQKEFDTPKQAADALIQAAETFDTAALKEILGPDSTDIISSVDPVADKTRAVAFASKAKEKITVDVDSKNPNRATVSVGNDDFPLPIPIVKEKGKWHFDTKAGREEILNRRIGADELDAIEVARGFVDAQNEYAQEKHGDSKVNEFAQRMISTPGKQDGLAWQNPDGTWGGPVGEGVAKAIEQGYSERTQPYHGYYFKVLKKQGPNAVLGKMDFVIDGAMIGGFALAAAPAQYRVTGVKTFIVGPAGIVYQKDLGPKTLETFKTMEAFDPDKTWEATNDQWSDDD